MKISLILVAFTFPFIAALGQQTPEEITDRFFETFESEGSSAALDELYASNPWVTRSADAITKLKSQMDGLNEDYVGRYYGYEKITEHQLNSSIFLQSFLVKYDRQPIRFTFIYYKPNDKWVVYAFKYDGNLIEEMEEATKLYYVDLDN